MIKKLTANWWGKGSGPSGNKASLNCFNNVLGAYINPISHISASISKLTWVASGASIANVNMIDSNGFAHFLAYAEASNETIASIIETDYINLEIEFDYKALINTLPKVVSNEVYRRMVGELDWKRIGYIQPALYGENLLPPFTEWTIHANATVKGPYELELNPSALDSISSYHVPVQPNQPYTFKGYTVGGSYEAYATDKNKAYLANPTLFANTTTTGDVIRSIIAPEGCYYIQVRMSNRSAATGKFTFSQPILVQGNTAKSFSPQKFGGVFTDYTPANEKAYEYKVKANGTNGTSAESASASGLVKVKNAILSKASDPNTFVNLMFNPSRSEKVSRERSLSQFAGRQDPVAEFGNARSFNLDSSFVIMERSELDALRMLVDSGDILLYRDGRGRREFVSIADLSITDEKPNYYQVSLPMTRVSYEEEV